MMSSAQIPLVCEDLKTWAFCAPDTGNGSTNRLREKVRQILAEHYDVTLFPADEISHRSYQGSRKSGYGDMDFLIGVGGGRVIDTAKIAAYNLDHQFIQYPDCGIP